jgi:outer membrane receptor protein involved in Fe transport
MMFKALPVSTRIKPTSLSIALLVALSASPCYSQEQSNNNEPEGNDGLVEKILVTASKRQTGLQETPIAVTVTSAQAIEQTQVLDINDLQQLVPTLRVTPLQRSTNTNFSIRGFGNGTNNIGIEPSVGVFIDGVYRSRAAAQIGDLPRLEQVEVLSGPQSTLFGKNASAGVVNVRTSAPSFMQEGRVKVGIGYYDQRLLSGYYTNGVTDKLAFSISGNVNQRDGYTESVVGLDTLNNRDRWNVRSQLLWEPTEDTRLRLIVDYSEIDERCCTVADVINGPTTDAVRALGGTVLDTSRQFEYESALNIDPMNQVTDKGISLELDADYDAFGFKSITSLRDNDSSFIGDVDYTSLDILTEQGETDIKTFTQEFRLTSNGDERLDWMLGAFYFSEELNSGDTLSYGVGTRPFFDILGLASLLEATEDFYAQPRGAFFNADNFVHSQFSQENDALSLYASVDYDITDKLTATFGLAYNDDKKDVAVSQVNTETFSSIEFTTTPTVLGVPLSEIPDFAGFVPTLQGSQFLPPMLEFPNSVEDGNTNDSKTTWSTRFAYELNRNFNIFATAATGFKASSWNLSRDSRPFFDDRTALENAGLNRVNQSYGGRFASPEDSTVYELGIKARFKRGAFNVTLFDQTIEGFQSSIFVGTGFVLANAGKQSTKGIEFDSKFEVIDDLIATFSGTILDPIYDSFEGASGLDGPTDLSGTQPAGIHEKTFVLGLTYNFDIGNGMTGFIRSDYLYESEAQIAENVPPELTREVGTLNASLGIDMDSGLAIQLWVRNLNNDEYFLSAFPPPVQGGSFSAYPNQPRTFGATVSYSF